MRRRAGIAAVVSSTRERASTLRRHVLEGRFVLPVAAAALWAGAFAVYASAMTNNDVAWCLVGTAKWLSGARLYHGVVDVNPPLFFYLDVPPVLLASLTGIPATKVFVAYVFALIALSTLLVVKLATPTAEPRRVPWGICIAALAAMTVFPSEDFGQREHLMLVFCLPYFFLIARRAVRDPIEPPLAVLVGALAAVGFCLKPQFLVVPLLLEAYLAWQVGSLWRARRPEAFAIVIVGALYAVSIPLLALEYLSRIVPYALLVYFQGYDQSLAFVVLKWETILLPAVAVSHLLSRRRQRRPQLADACLIGAVAFFVIYLTEMKGFSYHLVPVDGLMFLVIGSAIATAGRPALGGAAMVALLAIPALRGVYWNEVPEVLAPVVRERARGHSLYVFSSYVWAGFPLVDIVDARWPSRFPSLWTLPGAERWLRSHKASSDSKLADAYRQIEAYTVNAVVHDLEGDPPAVIVIDDSPDPRFRGTGFHYLSFFKRDPRFARIWTHYVKLTRIEKNGVGPFDVYIRREQPQRLSATESSRLLPP